MAAACHFCRRLLDQPDDPTTLDCGGDCLKCMAEIAEDPDCITAMKGIKMTLEETIKQATPLGGIYQHACPGGWTAYAAKSESGQFICQYVKAGIGTEYTAVLEKRAQSFAKWGKV